MPTEGSFTIGTVIRYPRGENEKPLGKAMIATVGEDGKTISVLWEDPILKPISNPFLITPNLPAVVLRDEDEKTIELSRLHPLFEFETSDGMIVPETNTNKANISLWKDRGDQLLRLGDPTSAIPYYEEALNCSSKVSVGGSILCSIEGYPKVAEIDCVNDDDTLDVMFVESGEESTIHRSEVLLAILPDDANSDRWQERILLNLSRCLLQQADIDIPNRAKYLKASVVACTLVLSIRSSHDQGDGDSGNDISSTSALLLRTRAYIGLSKWPHATADAKKLVVLNDNQGKRLLETIEREKKYQAKRDKNMVKAISRLVQTATSDSVSDEQVVTATTSSTKSTTTPSQVSRQSLISVLLVLAAAFLMQKLTN